MKHKKIDRSTKKWISLFNERLKELVKEKGFVKDGKWVPHPLEKFVGHYERIDAMPDRIKEAEEYADKLYSAMR